MLHSPSLRNWVMECHNHSELHPKARSRWSQVEMRQHGGSGGWARRGRPTWGTARGGPGAVDRCLARSGPASRQYVCPSSTRGVNARPSSSFPMGESGQVNCTANGNWKCGRKSCMRLNVHYKPCWLKPCIMNCTITVIDGHTSYHSAEPQLTKCTKKGLLERIVKPPFSYVIAWSSALQCT